MAERGKEAKSNNPQENDYVSKRSTKTEKERAEDGAGLGRITRANKLLYCGSVSVISSAVAFLFCLGGANARTGPLSHAPAERRENTSNTIYSRAIVWGERISARSVVIVGRSFAFGSIIILSAAVPLPGPSIKMCSPEYKLNAYSASDRNPL